MITLVLGGARSGKSSVAEQLATHFPAPVTYLATAAVEPDDADMAARVAKHQARRPTAWSTVEAGSDLAQSLTAVEGSVLVDSLGSWVARWPNFAVDIEALCRALRRRCGDTVIVSEEVGLGIHPVSEGGRRFRDALGEVNQAVADVAGDVLLVVAGRTMRLDRANR